MNAIEKLRKRWGLTQEAFAVRLGVAPFTVRRWEKGETSPSSMARRAIKEVFGVTIKAGKRKKESDYDK